MQRLLMQDPVYVFDRLDEFATVLIRLQEKDADTDAAIDKVLNTDSLRWFDHGESSTFRRLRPNNWGLRTPPPR